MNKIAQQFQNDVVARYQQKMAELVKRAEDTNLSWLEKLVDPISANIIENNNKTLADQEDQKYEILKNMINLQDFKNPYHGEDLTKYNVNA